jgi:hypothetical protein
VIIAVALGLIFFIPAIILFYSIFSTFSEVAWVLFFHVIATPKEKEKIVEKISEEEKSTILPATETIKTAEIDE